MRKDKAPDNWKKLESQRARERAKQTKKAIALLQSWVTAKARVGLFISGRAFWIVVAGSLQRMDKRPGMFNFASLSREIMVPVILEIYDSVRIEKQEGQPVVILDRLGDEISLIEFPRDDPEAQLPLLAMATRGFVN